MRLVNTAEFSIEEQVGILAKTDYLVGIQGAGFTLSIFMPEGGVVHEIFHENHDNAVNLLEQMSGHQRYSDLISSSIEENENEMIYLDPNEFTESILGHMEENNFLIEEIMDE